MGRRPPVCGVLALALWGALARAPPPAAARRLLADRGDGAPARRRTQNDDEGGAAASACLAGGGDCGACCGGCQLVTESDATISYESDTKTIEFPGRTECVCFEGPVEGYYDTRLVLTDYDDCANIDRAGYTSLSVYGGKGADALHADDAYGTTVRRRGRGRRGAKAREPPENVESDRS